MTFRVIAFEVEDSETPAKIQALEAADINGLSLEFQQTGMEVDLTEARMVGCQVRIAVKGSDDIESIQRYFNQPVRWVTRRELLEATAK